MSDSLDREFQTDSDAVLKERLPKDWKELAVVELTAVTACCCVTLLVKDMKEMLKATEKQMIWVNVIGSPYR